MIVPKTLFRVLNANINYEKYVYVMLRNKLYEHTKPKHEWNPTSQACFVAGMEYAYEILQNHTKYDGLPDINSPENSYIVKNIPNICSRMKTVDKRLSPIVKNGSIKELMK